MAKNTGLGKGLDALFKNSIVDKDEEINENEIIHELKLIEVEPNKEQARKKFDQESLEELAESIKRYGVIQPIIVTKKDGFYQIVAGERRWRASRIAKLTTIPAIIREDDERKNKEISLIENIQREDLNPIEKARGYKLLLDEYNLTQQRLSEIIGISRCAVTNTLRLLNLDKRIIDFALEGKLTEGHCRALMSIEDKTLQYDMALYVIETGASVREAERKMRLENRDIKKANNRKYEAIYRDIENRFQGFFGTKVKVDAGAKKGKIVIEYASNEDLERILELIN